MIWDIFPFLSFCSFSFVEFDIGNLYTGIYDKFANALSNAVQRMQVGNGFHEDVSQVTSSALYV